MFGVITKSNMEFGQTVKKGNITYFILEGFKKYFSRSLFLEAKQFFFPIEHFIKAVFFTCLRKNVSLKVTKSESKKG